jgi:glycosyltransferase involved in cell wall biosynthesis
MRYAAGLADLGAGGRLRARALLAAAADLVGFCRDRNVRHVHATSFGDAAHVLAMGRRLGGPTYSLLLTGGLPEHGTDHRSKVAAASCVACEGEHLVGELRQLGLKRDQILVLPPGVDLPDERTRDVAEQVHVVSLGPLVGSSGHNVAVAAVLRLREVGRQVRLTIYGDGPEREPLRREARKPAWQGGLRVLPPPEVWQDVLDEADVLLRLGEPSSVTRDVAAALAAGLPVVGDATGIAPDAVRPAADAAEAATEVQHLLDNGDLFRSHAAASRECASRSFSAWTNALRLFAHLRRHTPETFGRAT